MLVVFLLLVWVVSFLELVSLGLEPIPSRPRVLLAFVGWFGSIIALAGSCL